MTTTLDAEGRATSIADGLSGTVAYSYTADDLPLTVTLPGGLLEQPRYDAASRLTSLTLSGPPTASAPLSSTYGYGYSPLDWTTALTSTLNGLTSTQTLTHDADGRLTGWSSGGSTQSWQYDGNGNLTLALSNTVPTTYTYANGVPNELSKLQTPGQYTRKYAYDNNGDTTAITTTGSYSAALSYDSQARLVGVTFKSGEVVTMTYNAQGQRASYSMTQPGQPAYSAQFQYRGDLLGQAVVISGSTTYTDTYLYDQSGNPLELLRQQNGATSRYWYVLDGRGTVVALTDSNGNVVDRYAYDAWGALTSISETVPQRLRYAGYWYDQELGWYWVSVRSYDPTLKRWLQPDPSQQDGVRTYVYVHDVPSDETDPTGLDSCPTMSDLCEDTSALSALIGGVGAATYILYEGGKAIASFAYEGGNYVVTQIWNAYTADDSYTGPSSNPACNVASGQISVTCPTPDSQTVTLAPQPVVIVHSSHSYHVPPKTLPGFPGTKVAPRKTPYSGGMRKRWVDGAGNIYEWDYQHGAVEKYDRRGRHLGEFDPNTGEQTKESEPHRRVEP